MTYSQAKAAKQSEVRRKPLHLLAWHNPLPAFIEQAIDAGTLTIIRCHDKCYGDYDVPQGTVIAPNGVTIEYR